MFFKDLYHFNKFHFFILISFIFVTVFLNVKRGATAAPVFQYGMYAGKMTTADTQQLYIISINGERANRSDWSFVDRDIVQVSLQHYLTHKSVNVAVFNSMKNVFDRAGAGSLMKTEVFSNHITDDEFVLWYKKIIEKIIKEPVTLLEVFDQQFIYQNNSLIQHGSPQKVLSFDAE